MAAYSQPQWKDGGEGWCAVSRDIEKKSRKTPGGEGYQHKSFQTAEEEEGAEDYELREHLCLLVCRECTDKCAGLGKLAKGTRHVGA